MKNFFKIAIRILPIFAILVLAYVLYLNFYGDRNYNWFGSKYTKADIAAESKKADSIIDAYLIESAKYKNFSDQHPEWFSISGSASDNISALNLKTQRYLRDSIRSESLDSSTLIRFKKLEYKIDAEISALRFSYLNYPLNHIDGYHIQAVESLLKSTVKNEKDAAAYLNKLQKFPELTNQLIKLLEIRQKNSALAPRFLFPHILAQLQTIIGAMPVGQGMNKNPIYADFETKLNTSGLQPIQKQALLDSCKNILLKEIVPAISNLTGTIKNLESKALSSPGIWKMNDSEDFYTFLIKRQSGSDLSPDAIYDLGNDEINRIQLEITSLLSKNSINISAKDYFSRQRKQIDLQERDFLQKFNNHQSEAQKICPKLFKDCSPIIINTKAAEFTDIFSKENIKFKDSLIIFNKNGIAFPASMTKALSFYYGFPGQSLVRKFSNDKTECDDFNAFYQGWSLYALSLAVESGLFNDFQQDFGRLSLELLMSCHLVADIGIHSKKWTREQALQFYRTNTVMSEAFINYTVDYICAQPARSIAAKIGMLTILELRKKAQNALKEKFKLEEFHNEILKNGCLPLSFLEDIVDEYIRIKGS